MSAVHYTVQLFVVCCGVLWLCQHKNQHKNNTNEFLMNRRRYSFVSRFSFFSFAWLSTSLCGILSTAIAGNPTIGNTLPSVDVWHAVREALEENDGTTASALLLQMASSESVHDDLLGLIGETETLLAEADEDREKICDLYAVDRQNHPERADLAVLRQARCMTQIYAQKKYQQNTEMRNVVSNLWNDVLDIPVFAVDPHVVWEALSYWSDIGDVDNALRFLGLPKNILQTPVSSTDLEQREAHGKIALYAYRLADAVRDGVLQDQALLRLYRDVPETSAARSTLSGVMGQRDKKIAQLLQHQDRRLAAQRIRNLTARHENDAVVQTASTYLQEPAQTDAAEQLAQCEIYAFFAKTARKQRRYKDANAVLDLFDARCMPEKFPTSTDGFVAIRREAWFTRARVASLLVSKATPNAVNQFLKAYPSDGWSDDTVLWLAEYYKNTGDTDKAIKTFERVAQEYPDGDMGGEALFQKAMLFVSSGEIDKARDALQENITYASPMKDGRIFYADRARYWHARLLLFPQAGDIRTLHENETERRIGVEELALFAVDRPGTFYGHLAYRLGKYVGTNALIKKQDTYLGKVFDATFQKAQSEQGQSMPLRRRYGMQQKPFVFPESISSHSLWPMLRAGVQAGYGQESLSLISSMMNEITDRSLGGHALTLDERLAFAHLYTYAGVSGLAHSLLRAGGLFVVAGHPDDDGLLAWSLAYPHAFASSIEAGATKHGVPTSLLFGLAREESAFHARAASRSGAAGLCQLMPATAKEEALRQGFPAPSLDDLRQPQLNAMLGGGYLGRQLRSLSHPFLAVGAYNAGAGNMRKWLKAAVANNDGNAVPVDWFVANMHVEETRTYIQRVVGSWAAYATLDEDLPHHRDLIDFPLEVGAP